MTGRHTFNTKDCMQGDRIDVPPTGEHAGRAVIVAEQLDVGVRVIWFDDMGRGPYSAVLPHCTVTGHLYANETRRDTSFWDTHPDMTGKTGEV
jgi:hypothetical protein